MPDPVARLNTALSGHYRVESKLGEGGNGTVYLAEDLRHHRKVALDVLKPELAVVFSGTESAATVDPAKPASLSSFPQCHRGSRSKENP
jgi:hypothetical protein